MSTIPPDAARSDGRSPGALRPLRIHPGFVEHAENEFDLLDMIGVEPLATAGLEEAT